MLPLDSQRERLEDSPGEISEIIKGEVLRRLKYLSVYFLKYSARGARPGITHFTDRYAVVGICVLQFLTAIIVGVHYCRRTK